MSLSWMCNLHASLHHRERMEDMEVESEERAKPNDTLYRD